MKRMIRLLPILFALPLLGLFLNSQRIEKAEAVSTSYRYFIADKDNNNGFENSAANVSYSTLKVPYRFVLVSEQNNTYKIQSATNSKYLYINPLASENVTFSDEGSEPDGYVNVFEVGEYNSKHYIRASGTTFYLYPRTNYWKSYDSDHTTNSSCLLNIYSVEENSAPFVTAMYNIACTDLVKGPAKTGDNSWASASTAFSGLKQPTKNYLTTLAADMTDGDINTPERAVGKYDYIIKKYGTANYSNFINRTIPGLAVIDNIGFSSNMNNTPIIIVISFITVLSFTSILILKKKR